jgi:hypothetical protein
LASASNVGEILDAVDGLGVRDNTIFVFTSDNGPDPTSPSPKLTFYERERDWWTPANKLGVPQIFDLYADPREEYPATLTPKHGSPDR